MGKYAGAWLMPLDVTMEQQSFGTLDNRQNTGEVGKGENGCPLDSVN